MNLPLILSDVGLVVFVLVLAIDGIVLIFDLCLKLTKRPTISHQTWDNPALAIGLLGWQLIGTMGLAIHLFTRP